MELQIWGICLYVLFSSLFLTPALSPLALPSPPKTTGWFFRGSELGMRGISCQLSQLRPTLSSLV